VATPEGGQAIIDAALDAWKRVDIVINNACIVRDSPFDEMTPDRVEPLLVVHLKGAFNVTRPAWKLMRERKYGRVVNTTSAAGILGAENMSNYGAAKTGFIGLHSRAGGRRSPVGHQRERPRPDTRNPHAGAGRPQ
jgi:NAD(P)-dependent dehydrogenase (short-subunit alcohol dehydrogenase family)